MQMYVLYNLKYCLNNKLYDSIHCALRGNDKSEEQIYRIYYASSGNKLSDHWDLKQFAKWLFLLL